MNLNDRYMNVFKSPCSKCKHFDIFEYACPAFPKGVPANLLSGSLSHNVVIAGQEGKTIFEAK